MPDPKLLYVTQVAPYDSGPAGVHGVLDQSATALAQLADIHGREPVHVTDVRALKAQDIDKQGNVLALFTIGETPWTSEQKRAIQEGVTSGRVCLVAVHAATDACYRWDYYGRLVGARFNGHPWTQKMHLEVVDTRHPATAHLGDTWDWTDEVYQFKDLLEDARVLLQVPTDQLDPAAEGADQPAFGFPLSWCFTEGHGRVFSTTLGHFPEAWESPTYLRHLSGGMAWALGQGS